MPFENGISLKALVQPAHFAIVIKKRAKIVLHFTAYCMKIQNTVRTGAAKHAGCVRALISMS